MVDVVVNLPKTLHVVGQPYRLSSCSISEQGKRPSVEMDNILKFSSLQPANLGVPSHE